MQQQIQFILTILISVGALFVSFLSYRNSLRLQNENHLYNLKVDLYSRFLTEIVKLTTTLEDILDEVERLINSSQENKSAEIEALATKVDRISFEFDDFIVSNSLIIPEKVLVKLKDFDLKILNDSELESDNKSQIDLDKLNKFISSLYSDCNAIVGEFRQDLHIDKLNKSLFNRLKRNG